jgi:WD40 repeat protein
LESKGSVLEDYPARGGCEIQEPEQSTLMQFSNSVTSLAFSDAKQLLVAASWDGTIKLYDCASGAVTDTLSGHIGGVFSIALRKTAPTMLASAGNDKLIKLWDLDAPQERCFDESPGISYSVEFSSKGEIVKQLPSDNNRTLWKATKKEGPTEDVYVLTCTPVSRDEGVQRSNRKRTRLFDNLLDHAPEQGVRDQIYCLAFSPRGRLLLATGTRYGFISIWDVAERRRLFGRKVHKDPIQSIAFSAHGDRIASVSWDGTVGLWKVPRIDCLKRLGPLVYGDKRRLNAVAFTPDGTMVAIGGDDCTLHLWDPVTNHLTHAAASHKKRITSLAFTRDGRRIITGSEDREVWLWNRENLKREHCALTGFNDRVWSVANSLDDKRLAAASWDRTVKVWNMETCKEEASLLGHANSVVSVAFSPDGKTLATASWDNTVKLWHLQTGQELITLKHDDEKINCVAFSPDGRMLASGNNGAAVLLWHAATPEDVAAQVGSV